MQRKPFRRLRPVLVRTLASALPLPKPRRFTVLSRGRTGSNMLLSLLRSHPRLRVQGEVIGAAALEDPARKNAIQAQGAPQYVGGCFRRAGFETAIGIKLLYYQLQESWGIKWGIERTEEVVDSLRLDPEMRIIHLKRRNRLHTLVSRKLAGATQQYALGESQDNKYREVTIHLSPEECIEEWQRTTAWEEYYDEFFSAHPVLELFYEDLAADPQGHGSRILGFLDIRPRPLSTRTKKQRQRGLNDIVENYEQLSDHFEGTEWSKFFQT